MVYEGTQIPELSEQVLLDKEIKGTFHSEKHIGFILKNTGVAGYELRLYNLMGTQLMAADFQGEYGKTKIVDDEIIMVEGSKGCIFTTKGHMKFQGDLGMDTSEIVPVSGKNRYLLMNSNVVKKVRLAK